MTHFFVLSLAIEQIKQTRKRGNTVGKGILKDITNFTKSSTPSHLRNKVIPEPIDLPVPSEQVESNDKLTKVIDGLKEREEGKNEPSIDKLDPIIYNQNGTVREVEYAPLSIKGNYNIGLICVLVLDDFENELVSTHTDLNFLAKAVVGPSIENEVQFEREIPSCDEL